MKSILDWFETLPLIATTSTVAGLCALFALACTPIRSVRLKIGLATVSPFLIAYCMYWLPVWTGDDPFEYRAWERFFIVIWAVPGVLASFLVLLASRTVRHSRTK